MGKEKITLLGEKGLLLTDGILIGLFVGSLTIFYRYILSLVEHVRGDIYGNLSPSNIVLVIIGAALLGFITYQLLQWAPLSGGSGIPQVQGEILGIFSMRGHRVVTSKIIGGSIATLVGLSLGREGPSIQIGAAGGKFLGKLMSRSKTQEKLFITAGAAAGLSAAFSAPISGVVFILEELHRHISKTVLAISLVAAVVADYMAAYIFKLEPVFKFGVIQVTPIQYYPLLAILAILVAFVGVLFNMGIVWSLDMSSRVRVHPGIKMAISFGIVAAMGFVFLEILGGGHSLIESLVHIKHPIIYLMILLIGKLILTWFSYSTGAQGGIFLPVLVLGGIIGIIFYEITFKFGFIPEFLKANMIILAMAAMLTAVVRSPLLSVVLVFEMNDNLNNLLGLCFVSIIAYFIAEGLKNLPIYDTLLERMVEGENINEDFTTDKLVMELVIPVNSKVDGMEIKNIGFPDKALIVEIARNGKTIIPGGCTVINSGDVIRVITTDEDSYKVRNVIHSIIDPTS